MVSAWGGVAVVWVVTAGCVFATMVSDEDWQRSDDTHGRALGAAILLTGVATVLPAAFVIGFAAIAPAETLRGRTIPPIVDETIAGVLVLVGVYFAYIARTRPLLADDESTLSMAASQRIWTVVGAGVAAAAVVALAG